MNEPIDVVRSLGHLALGTRLKRIGERLQSQTQRILDAQEFGIPAGQFPFLSALDHSGPLAIGGLAKAVGVTQPAATRNAASLAEAGLVEISLAKGDQRRKRVALTKKGKRLLDRGKRNAFPLIEGAVKEVCLTASGPLLDQLAAIEDALAEQPLEARATARKKR